MGFLSGPVTMQSFRIGGTQPRQFGSEHIKILEKRAIGRSDEASATEDTVGFLAGRHVFDVDFSLEKNVIGDALHFGIRIDTNTIPSAVRKAWMQMELAVLTVDNPSGRPTKLQRQEAREAVEARCDEEAKSGRFRRMQQFPALWDARNALLHFGGTSSSASEQCAELFSEAFGLELNRLHVGRRAQEWAAEVKRRKALDETVPSALQTDARIDIAWWSQEAGNFDFLGNEFLLWLWWRWETQSDTMELPDGSEVTGMLARTLTLQCPRGESGKETITAESPVRLPEAAQAIHSGKLPRKSGLVLVRQGQQYELVFQPEAFMISGAKIVEEEKSKGEGAEVERMESVRSMHETIDLLFRVFCNCRISRGWPAELEQIRHWLKAPTKARRA